MKGTRFFTFSTGVAIVNCSHIYGAGRRVMSLYGPFSDFDTFFQVQMVELDHNMVGRSTNWLYNDETFEVSAMLEMNSGDVLKMCLAADDSRNMVVLTQCDSLSNRHMWFYDENSGFLMNGSTNCLTVELSGNNMHGTEGCGTMRDGVSQSFFIESYFESQSAFPIELSAFPELFATPVLQSDSQYKAILTSESNNKFLVSPSHSRFRLVNSSLCLEYESLSLTVFFKHCRNGNLQSFRPHYFLNGSIGLSPQPGFCVTKSETSSDLVLRNCIEPTVRLSDATATVLLENAGLLPGSVYTIGGSVDTDLFFNYDQISPLVALSYKPDVLDSLFKVKYDRFTGTSKMAPFLRRHEHVRVSSDAERLLELTIENGSEFNITLDPSLARSYIVTYVESQVVNLPALAQPFIAQNWSFYNYQTMFAGIRMVEIYAREDKFSLAEENGILVWQDRSTHMSAKFVLVANQHTGFYNIFVRTGTSTLRRLASVDSHLTLEDHDPNDNKLRHNEFAIIYNPELRSSAILSVVEREDREQNVMSLSSDDPTVLTSLIKGGLDFQFTIYVWTQ